MCGRQKHEAKTQEFEMFAIDLQNRSQLQDRRRTVRAQRSQQFFCYALLADNQTGTLYTDATGALPTGCRTIVCRFWGRGVVSQPHGGVRTSSFFTSTGAQNYERTKPFRDLNSNARNSDNFQTPGFELASPAENWTRDVTTVPVSLLSLTNCWIYKYLQKNYPVEWSKDEIISIFISGNDLDGC